MRKSWTTHKGWEVGLATFSVLALALYAYAATLSVHSFTFDPSQTRLVSSEWMIGAGCPTAAKETTGTFTDPACPTGADSDTHNQGLVLFKTGDTANIASAGAFITGIPGSGITLTELGYDIRTGSHCGAGAPRFNVTTADNVTHFVGCNTGTVTASSPAWQRLRWTAQLATTAFPPIPPGSTVTSISIVYDEGTDAGPVFSGLAVLDNIDINGTLLSK